jgi:riboflavin biosynthesis pyrimidine reductase
MYVHTDFPYGQAFDANDMAAAKGWWGPGDSPWVRANIITDTQGNAVDTDGTSNGLTGGADRALLAALRAVADVVVMGGATVRAEPESVPRDCPVVIVSRSANIPAAAIDRANGEVIVLHHRSAEVPPGVVGIVLPRFTGTSIVSALSQLGHRRIVVEGGVTLLRTMLQSRSITEWCQTISPHLSRSEPSPSELEPGGVLTLSAHDSAGFRYTRKTLNGAPVAGSE